MAVPKRKTSKSRRNMRRSHDALKTVCLSIDSKSGDYKLHHHMNKADGTYRGIQIVKKKVAEESEG